MYAAMLKNLPKDEDYPVYDIYPLRRIYRKTDKGFWKEVSDFVKNGQKSRVILVRDFPGYSIGPHTDSTKEKASFIFYLTETAIDGGTSMFKRDGFECNGSKHHDFGGFELVKTAPFAPNSYFGFERSNTSFHGVLPCKSVRNTLQWSLHA